MFNQNHFGTWVYVCLLVVFFGFGLFMTGKEIHHWVTAPSEREQREAIWMRLTNGEFKSYRDCVNGHKEISLPILKYCREWHREVTFFEESGD